MSGTDLERLVREPEPYAAPARLQARIALHGFGPDAEDFHRWVWRVAVRPDELPSDARVLEVGVGSARMWRAGAVIRDLGGAARSSRADRGPLGWSQVVPTRPPGAPSLTP